MKRQKLNDLSFLLARRRQSLQEYCLERGIKTEEDLRAHIGKEGLYLTQAMARLLMDPLPHAVTSKPVRPVVVAPVPEQAAVPAKASEEQSKKAKKSKDVDQENAPQATTSKSS